MKHHSDPLHFKAEIFHEVKRKPNLLYEAQKMISAALYQAGLYFECPDGSHFSVKGSHGFGQKRDLKDSQVTRNKILQNKKL